MKGSAGFFGVMILLILIVILLASAGVDFDSILHVQHVECAGPCLALPIDLH